MATTVVRHAVVAGQFYPRNPDKLRAEIRSYTEGENRLIPALGCVVPHAGYIYSGHVAGAVYARLDLPTRLIVPEIGCARIAAPDFSAAANTLSIHSSARHGRAAS